jgi:G3E family GTPase
VVLVHPYLSQRYELDGVVTLVDAVNGLATLAAHDEALRQVAVADRLVITKSDLVPQPAAIEKLRQELARINPGASVLDAANGEASPAALIGLGLFDVAAKPSDVDAWLAIDAVMADGHRHVHDTNRHGDDIAAFALIAEESLLRSTHGPKLLRLKGLVHLVEHPQGPVVLHAAQQVIHPPVSLPAWPSADRRSRLVLIVRGLDPDIVRKLWAAFLGQA